jgi:SM-20-related protein
MRERGPIEDYLPRMRGRVGEGGGKEIEILSPGNYDLAVPSVAAFPLDSRMSTIDLDGFSRTPLECDPYDYLIVPGFLKTAALEAIAVDYPQIDRPGSFPLSGLKSGPAFEALVAELKGPEIRDAFATKFGIDLTGRPTTITARGRCQAKDGQIHTDTETKIITVLIYMNDEWEQEGGRLRVLRSGNNLNDYAAEVPPAAGTLLAFRRSNRSWHGHEPFVGERRVLQLNWVTDQAVVRREEKRHKLSAWFKNILGRA